jgi:hypothetical protein
VFERGELAVDGGQLGGVRVVRASAATASGRLVGDTTAGRARIGDHGNTVPFPHPIRRTKRPGIRDAGAAEATVAEP